MTQQPTIANPKPLMERTLAETQKHLEQEKDSSHKMTTEICQRRRLASFSGLSSSGILLSSTSWGAPEHNQSLENHKGSKLTVSDQASLGSSSLRPSTGSSGKVTPMTTVSPLDLHLVREQMVVALERLKEMEEQVKTIPLLQVKIAVLKEEKNQLSAIVKNLESQHSACNLNPDLEGLDRKRPCRTGSTANQSKPEKDEGKREFDEKVGSWEHTALSDLDYCEQVNTEMQLTVNDNVDMGEMFVHLRSCCRDVATETKLNVRSVEVGVTESMLGVVSDTELELEIRQQNIQVLRDQVQTLEVELKEALLKAELCKLKGELQEADAHTHAANMYSAQPGMQSIATQTGMLTRTIGIGNHVQLAHSATGEDAVQTLNTVGVSCQPETCDVASGLDTPIEMWEMQKKVDKRDQCIGTQSVPTCSQSVGTSLSVCDVGVMTVELKETLKKKKASSRTVGCGDCTIDVNVNMVKPLVSQGIVTEPVRSLDIGVKMTPKTMSQCTNTDVHAVSRSTSTSSLVATNILTHESHTNTVHDITRTLGDGKTNNQNVTGNMQSIVVGTPVNIRDGTVTYGTHNVTTRDIGVGLANINENFLVGLQTRNMACGPSRLPDPIKTRSIGVEVGDGRIRDMDGNMRMPVQFLQANVYAQTEPGLDHYIDRMQRLLKEQQSLLTSSHLDSKDEVTPQPQHLPDTQCGGNGISIQISFCPLRMIYLHLQTD